MMMVQRPVRLKNRPLFRIKPVSRQKWKNLSPEKKQALREDFQVIQERVLQVMRDMPSALFFIFR